MIGSQRYSIIQGYASTCAFAKRVDKEDQVSTRIVAMDALYFSKTGKKREKDGKGNDQWSLVSIERELKKALCGFEGYSLNVELNLKEKEEENEGKKMGISTGNWGIYLSSFLFFCWCYCVSCFKF